MKRCQQAQKDSESRVSGCPAARIGSEWGELKGLSTRVSFELAVKAPADPGAGAQRCL